MASERSLATRKAYIGTRQAEKTRYVRSSVLPAAKPEQALDLRLLPSIAKRRTNRKCHDVILCNIGQRHRYFGGVPASFAEIGQHLMKCVFDLLLAAHGVYFNINFIGIRKNICHDFPSYDKEMRPICRR